MAQPDRVVLVDGSNITFRAYYALPANLATSRGLHTNAVLGFATTFRKLLAGRSPRYGAVVFDAPGKTQRAERYPEYKADRVSMGDDLVEQLPWIDKVVAAQGYPILRVPGVEADDVIGTLARQAVEAGCEVVIVSTDKDFAQLVGPRVRMLDSFRDVTYDAELVRKKWGVPPERFVDFLALVGDKIDNIPGVPGIGAKGAAQLLESYGSLAGALEHVGELKGRARKALEEHREQALLSQELARIDQHVELEVGLADLALPEVDRAAQNALYRELEFYSLLSEEEVEAAAGEAAGEGRAYAACGDAEGLSALLAEARAGTLAVHPMFDREERNRRRLIGLALAARPGAALWVRLHGEGAAPLGDPRWSALRAALEDPALPKVAHDAKALWRGLRGAGVTLAGVAFDTRLASFLVEPTKLIPHRLGQVAKEYLHRAVRQRKAVVGPGKEAASFGALSLEAQTAHACQLVDAVIELLPILRERLEEAGLTRVLHEVELPLSWVLGAMEEAGILVDPAELARLGEELRAELADLEARIHALAGRPFNVGSTKQLSQVLFEELKLPVLKRTKTGYSTAVEVLERLAKDHEICRLLLEQRKVAKLINTYTDVLQREADPDTHRIHTTIQQTVGATGRLITTDPDLQRTPVRGERGQQIRRAFVAPPGWRIVSADWSQIELRLMAHAAQDPLLIEAFREGRDVHRATAARLFDVPLEAVTTEQRRIGKTINFATIYGQGATALGQILDVPRKEAQRYIDGFFATYQPVRAWLDRTIEEALERGYVTTLLGRRRYIPELASNNVMIKQAGMRIAANTPLQGSAADICKLAMLQLDRRLREEGRRARLVLQVHDELVLEAPEDEVEPVARAAREVMERATPLSVPLAVDVGVGPSWGDAH